MEISKNFEEVIHEYMIAFTRESDYFNYKSLNEDNFNEDKAKAIFGNIENLEMPINKSDEIKL